MCVCYDSVSKQQYLDLQNPQFFATLSANFAAAAVVCSYPAIITKSASLVLRFCCCSHGLSAEAAAQVAIAAAAAAQVRVYVAINSYLFSCHVPRMCSNLRILKV